MGDDGDVSSVELGEKGYSYKEIVMRALQRASDSLSVEFRGGYYSSDSGSDYIQDTREIACSHVQVLATLLISKMDKQMLKEYSDFKKDLTKLKKSFIDDSTAKESVILGSDYYKNPTDKFLLEEFKQKKLDLYIDLYEKLSLCLGRKKFLEMVGGTF